MDINLPVMSGYKAMTIVKYYKKRRIFIELHLRVMQEQNIFLKAYKMNLIITLQNLFETRPWARKRFGVKNPVQAYTNNHHKK